MHARIEGDAVPDYGAVVTRDGALVGVVTSPAASPRLGTIGLAILVVLFRERRSINVDNLDTMRG